jgi:anaerobic dimethyl sulfoxide reductase subunit B (iron-sulfur subunit)
MSYKQLGFKYVVENCIQCHACEVACKSWRGVELGVNWRKVENIWSGSYPNVTCQSVSVSCMHCLEPACLEVCPVGAISQRSKDGIVVVDRNACISCGACHEACPINVPQYGKDKAMQKCDMCVGQRTTDTDVPPCVDTCPTKALTLVQMDVMEKMTTEKTMQELVKKAKNSSWSKQTTTG